VSFIIIINKLPEIRKTILYVIIKIGKRNLIIYFCEQCMPCSLHHLIQNDAVVILIKKKSPKEQEAGFKMRERVCFTVDDGGGEWRRKEGGCVRE